MTSGAASGGPDQRPAESDDVLELAGSRWLTRLMNAPRPARNRWRRPLGLVIALAIGLTVGLSLHRSATHQPQRSASHDVAQASLSAVLALADHNGPLVSYIRQASQAHACAPVAVGHSPRHVIIAALHRAFPDFAFKDAATTLDQFTGLCSVEVRETRPGAVVVVSIASPVVHRARAAYTRLETGFESNGQVTTKYALAVNRAGWQVLAGASGTTARLPGAEQLLRLAQNPSLTW